MATKFDSRWTVELPNRERVGEEARWPPPVTAGFAIVVSALLWAAIIRLAVQLL